MLSIYSLFEGKRRKKKLSYLKKQEQKFGKKNFEILKKRGVFKEDKPLFTSPKPGNQRYSKPVWRRFDKEKNIQPYKK